jgi:hypothetical protein
MKLKASISAAALTVAFIPLTACSKSVEQPKLEPFSSEQAQDARHAADKWVGSRGRALFICGAASGLGLFAGDEWAKGFQPDGMTGGRLVFIINDEGRPDVVLRSALQRYSSAIEEGGEVVHMTAEGAESWLVVYSSGVVEVHNLTTVDGQLVDLWTASRSSSVVPASAKIFRATCMRA